MIIFCPIRTTKQPQSTKIPGIWNNKRKPDF